MPSRFSRAFATLPALPAPAAAFLASAAMILFAACGGPDKVSHQWYAMDTDFSAVLHLVPRAKAKVPPESAFAALEAESRRLELIFSDFLPYSALARLKGRSGDTLAVPEPELAEVLRAAEKAAFEAGGAFDITLHGLKAAWGLSSGDSGRVPADSALAAAMAGNPAFRSGPGDHPALFPPFRMLSGDRILLLRDSLSFDLGGIAKGYAVDRLHALLDTAGFKVHLVQAGGDMRVGGMKPGGPWRIGIRHPRILDSLAGTLRMETGRAVSTSGDYERYFLENGVRFHHIFDPRTGRPAGPWCSVTVLAATSLWADALTEPLFVLGPRSGAALLSRFGAQALWIREIRGTGGMGEMGEMGEMRGTDPGAQPRLCHVASPGLESSRYALADIPPCPPEAP